MTNEITQIGSKTGNGAFAVHRQGALWHVKLGDCASTSDTTAQAAADRCRHDMHMMRGDMLYFSAANALEAILETGEAE